MPITFGLKVSVQIMHESFWTTQYRTQKPWYMSWEIVWMFQVHMYCTVHIFSVPCAQTVFDCVQSTSPHLKWVPSYATYHTQPSHQPVNLLIWILSASPHHPHRTLAMCAWREGDQERGMCSAPPPWSAQPGVMPVPISSSTTPPPAIVRAPAFCCCSTLFSVSPPLLSLT